MTLRALLLLLLLLISYIGSAQAKLGQWTQYKSQNFTLYSDRDKSDVEKALRDFEVFRASIFEVLNLDKSKTYVPVDIYAFRRKKDFGLIKPKGNVAGYFQITARGPVMVIGPGNLRKLDLSILYHEYIHYLVRVNSSFNYPRWFNEGTAELYSSLDYDDDFVIIGKVARLAPSKNSRLMDLKRLLTKTDIHLSGNSAFQYYSSAWLLVHFLQFSGSNGFDDYNASLFQFLNLYNEGVEPLKAFEESFPVSLEELQKQLKRYSLKRQFSAMRMPKPKINLDYTAEQLDQGQLYANMSHLAFSMGLEESSTDFLEQALKLNNAKALSVKAYLLGREGKTEESLSILDTLIRTKGIEPWVYLNIGQAYKELMKHMSERKDEMRRLAVYYLGLAKKQGSFSQTQVLLADLYWGNDEKEKAAESIIDAVVIMPSNVYVNFLAGSYMVELKNEPYARFFLNNVINWSKNPEHIAQAQKWLDSFET